MICMGTVPSEGGRIYVLTPGQAPLWVNPQQWGLICRVLPYWASLPGSPFLQAEVDLLNWSLQHQPRALAAASGAPERVSVADDDYPDDYDGATIGLVPRLAPLLDGDDAGADAPLPAYTGEHERYAAGDLSGRGE